MRKALLIALGVLAAALAAGVTILLRARASRGEGVVSERVLETMTRDELYELAKEYEIPGRSKMKKPDLLDAVSRAERSG
jgi:Rho termination factor-like protein